MMRFTLTCLAVAIAEALIFSQLSLPIALTAHCVLVGALYFTTPQDTQSLLLVLLTATLGPLGTAICLLMALLYPLYCKLTTPLKGLLDTFFPKTTVPAHEILFERLKYGMDRFDPKKYPLAFTDVLNYGSTPQKQLAIEKIIRYYHAEFGPTLRQGTRDKTNAIRVLSATALAKLDDLFFQKFQDLKETEHNSLKYAQHCMEYSLSQTCDATREANMRHRAIEAFEQHTDKSVSLAALGHLYLLEGEPEKALKPLEHALKSDPCTKTQHHYLQALLQLGKFSTLRQLPEAFPEAIRETWQGEST